MRVRKTWFSYLLWFLFSCSFAVIFYFSMSSFLSFLGFANVRQSEWIIAISAFVLVIFFCLIEWVVNCKSNRGREKREKIYTVIGIVVLCILFFLFRILLISEIDENHFRTLQLFQDAMIEQGNHFEFSAWTLPQLYTSLLSSCFLFLGNKGIAVWFLQTFLQFLSFVFAYAAIKRLAGRVPALMAALGLAVLAMFFRDVLDSQISTLLLLIFMISIWILSFYQGVLKNRKGKVVFSFIISLLFGVLAGYDNAFSVLLFLPIIVCSEMKLKNGLQKAFNIGLNIAGSLIGFFLVAFLTNVLNGTISLYGIEDYFLNRYAVHFRLDYMQNFLETDFLLVFLVLCISYIIMYLKTEHDEVHLFVFIAFITVTFLIFFNPAVPLGYYFILAVCFMTIAGAGVRNLVLSDVTDNIKEEHKKEESVELPVESNEDKVEIAVETKETEEIEETEEKIIPQINYIENPLPLPKKHEKKEMDYGFEPEEDKMHFDLEITDDNAFYDV